jgi:hypothetical protein
MRPGKWWTLRVGPTGAPQGVPAARVLLGDSQLVGDLSLGAAGGKQRAGLMRMCSNAWRSRRPQALRRVGQARSCHRNRRSSLGLRAAGGVRGGTGR